MGNSFFKEFYQFVYHQGDNEIGHGHNFVTVTIIILTLSKKKLIPKIVTIMLKIFRSFCEPPKNVLRTLEGPRTPG